MISESQILNLRKTALIEEIDYAGNYQDRVFGCDEKIIY